MIALTLSLSSPSSASSRTIAALLSGLPGGLCKAVTGGLLDPPDEVCEALVGRRFLKHVADGRRAFRSSLVDGPVIESREGPQWIGLTHASLGKVSARPLATRTFIAEYLQGRTRRRSLEERGSSACLARGGKRRPHVVSTALRSNDKPQTPFRVRKRSATECAPRVITAFTEC